MASGPPTADALAQARSVLSSRFGHSAFRPGQEEALRSVLAGRSILAVMPTGSGKSLIYQLPALLADGLTVVISPLIALMKDQVDELTRRRIPATFVNSSLSLEEQRNRLGRCMRGEFRLLYVAPERMRNGAFCEVLRRVSVTRMAVDEAHCISEWGHDFRPDYRRLKEFRAQMGAPSVTALTATATPRVQHDIVESLGLKPEDVDVHVHGFDRPNLIPSVVHASDEDAKDEFLRNFLEGERGAGIIYVGTRKMAEGLAERLKDLEPTATAYHAGQESEERSAAREAFLRGKARIIVATIAFGMGIDKRDVRFVIHYQYPASVEGYYQEIGRAGRDGLPARCVLLYSPGDRMLREFFIDINYPAREQVEAVYDTLWEIEDNPVLMTYREIAEECGEGIKEGHVGSAVRLLDGAGVTRALTGEATALVRTFRPAAEILRGLRGPSQRRVLEALSVAADLETPGDYDVDLRQIASASGLTADQVRRALTSLDSEGHLHYEPPFRGRGVEKLVEPPPPFHKVPIDWKRQDMLRGIEEEKLAAMEDYIHTSKCRRRYIVEYFGETSDLRCGVCDRCEAAKPGAAKPGGILQQQPQIAMAVLACMRDLQFPLGATRVAQVLTGSRAKEIIQWGLRDNAAYGALTAKPDAVKEVIARLLTEGYLKREGGDRPVLALTKLGEKEAERVDLSSMAAKPLKQSPPRRRGGGEEAQDNYSETLDDDLTSDPASEMEEAKCRLDRLLDTLLECPPEQAREVVEHLKLFNPGVLAVELAERFDGRKGVRERSRAVWAVGELCGEHGIEFLTRCLRDTEANVRRLAASALGKAASVARAAATRVPSALAAARDALATLANDAAPQVRQHAAKALADFEQGGHLPRGETFATGC